MEGYLPPPPPINPGKPCHRMVQNFQNPPTIQSQTYERTVSIIQLYNLAKLRKKKYTTPSFKTPFTTYLGKSHHMDSPLKTKKKLQPSSKIFLIAKKFPHSSENIMSQGQMHTIIDIGSMSTCALGTQCTILLCYFNRSTALFGLLKWQCVTTHVYQKAKVAIELLWQ